MKFFGLGITELTIIVVVYLVPAIVCAIISMMQAQKKGYSSIGFFLLGFFFNVIGVLIAFLIQDKTAKSEPSPANRLLEYKQLLDSGAITQEEFDAKKRELL